MRWQLCYGVMMAALCSVLAYAACSNNSFMASPAESAVLVNPSCEPADEAPSAIQETENADVVLSNPGLIARGETRDRVRALLGEPNSMSDDGDRWTYAERIVLFKNDRVAGLIMIDSAKAARIAQGNRLSAWAAMESTAQGAPKHHSGKTNSASRRVSSTNAAARSASRAAASPMSPAYTIYRDRLANRYQPFYLGRPDFMKNLFPPRTSEREYRGRVTSVRTVDGVQRRVVQRSSFYR